MTVRSQWRHFLKIMKWISCISTVCMIFLVIVSECFDLNLIHLFKFFVWFFFFFYSVQRQTSVRRNCSGISFLVVHLFSCLMWRINDPVFSESSAEYHSETEQFLLRKTTSQEVDSVTYPGCGSVLVFCNTYSCCWPRKAARLPYPVQLWKRCSKKKPHGQGWETK